MEPWIPQKTVFTNKATINNILESSAVTFLASLWPVHVADLVVQGQEGDGWVNGLSAFGTQPDHFQLGLVDFLSQLVHSNVTGGTHQNRSAGHTNMHMPTKEGYS